MKFAFLALVVASAAARVANAQSCDDADAACQAFPAPTAAPPAPGSEPTPPAAEPTGSQEPPHWAPYPRYAPQQPATAPTGRPTTALAACPDEAPSAWSITGFLMGWDGPYVGVSGELGFSEYAGASLVLATWYERVSYDSDPPIIVTGYTHLFGANAALYPFGGLEGLRLGLEVGYAVLTNDEVHGFRSEEDMGAGFAIFVGHKVIRKSGFTFVTDLGFGAQALLRLGMGWSG